MNTDDNEDEVQELPRTNEDEDQELQTTANEGEDEGRAGLDQGNKMDEVDPRRYYSRDSY